MFLRPTSLDEATRALAETGFIVAAGEPCPGLAGMRRTREQALEASRVQRALGTEGHRCLWAREVRLEALLLNDEDRAREFVAERGLATIPNAPLDVVPTPAFMRPVIPFAAYDSPGPYSSDRTGSFYVTVPDAKLPAAVRERILRDHCRFELAATALHEGYPGHHLHLIHAQQQPSDTRKNVWTPLTVEGWALYCEDMMGEEGFYASDEELFFQRVHLLWRAMRILLDVGLHTRGMTPEHQKWFAAFVNHMSSRHAISREVLESAADFIAGQSDLTRPALLSAAGRHFAVRSEELLFCEGSYGTILLEEDAARKVGEGAGEVRYRLDSLGIPLVEIATTPDIGSPEEAAKVLEQDAASPVDGYLVFQMNCWNKVVQTFVPTGKPVRLEMTSDDVIHSFWVPELSGKLDLLPNQVNELTLVADKTGEYWGECAEFCGTQHAKMKLVVIVQTEQQFAAWLEHQQTMPPPPEDDLTFEGREVFLGSACVYCHTVRGTNASGDLGPDLTHLASRLTLASGILDNNRGNLAGWIVDPQHLKPGNLMPPSNLNSGDLQSLLDYLATLE